MTVASSELHDLEPDGDQKVLELFDLIRQYAERQGWIPIGWRIFTVGDWKITVNGTPHPRDGIDPWHALIENQRVVAMMIAHPYGGSVAGWKDTEAEFCAAMRQALGQS